MNQPTDKPIFIATRGSALALAQSNKVLGQCRAAFPNTPFELKIIKTTGDKLQTASMALENATLPKGLFTKELEVALLNQEADLAVHSLKDLPTELPPGLILGAVGERADVRDVLIFRAKPKADAETPATIGRTFGPDLVVRNLPHGATVATSSTRRKSQLLHLRPDLKIVEIRGNVATRARKLAENPELDATILALAGLTRLHFLIQPDGRLTGEGIPEGLGATVLSLEEMLPCVGQGAIGIETRQDDERIQAVCRHLNHLNTQISVTAERAFLAGMGGGCQSPVAAHAEVNQGRVSLRALAFFGTEVREWSSTAESGDSALLGRQMATRLLVPAAP